MKALRETITAGFLTSGLALGMFFVSTVPSEAQAPPPPPPPPNRSIYHGGRVIPVMDIIPIYYGTWPPADQTSEQNYLINLALYMSGVKNPPGQETVLRQYGVEGASVRAAFFIADNNPRALGGGAGGEIEQIIDGFQSSSGISYAPDRLFLLLPGPGYSACPGGCAFHAWRGDGKYYAVVPHDTQPFLLISSEEVFEAATDPGFDAWDEIVDLARTAGCASVLPVDPSIQILGPFNNLAHTCATSAFVPASQVVLHVTGITSDGKLWHTVQKPNLFWTKYGDVKAVVGSNPSPFLDVDMANILNTFLHVVTVGQNGHLYHTIRVPDGSWLPFGDINGVPGITPTSFTRVSAAEVAGELHVCAVTSSGGLRHTVRHENQSWEPFGDPLQFAGNPGTINDVDCTNVNDELHVAVVTSSGKLFHTIRHANGSWLRFGDVQAAAGSSIGPVKNVSVRNVSGLLHLTTVTAANVQFHSIRPSSPGVPWSPLFSPGGPPVATGESAVLAEALQLVDVTPAGALSHRQRNRDGTWTALGDISQFAGPAPGLFVRGTGCSILTPGF